MRRYWETLTFSVFHTAESDAADSGEGSNPKRGQNRQFISWNKQKRTHQIWSTILQWCGDHVSLYKIDLNILLIEYQLLMTFSWPPPWHYFHMRPSCHSMLQWPRKAASRLWRTPGSTYADSLSSKCCFLPYSWGIHYQGRTERSTPCLRAQTG